MKYFISFMLSILILIMPIVFLSGATSVYTNIYDYTGIYNELDKNFVNEATNIFVKFLHKKSDDMIYFYDNNLIFKAQEIFHMFEVRNIFYNLKKFSLFLFVFILGYLFLKKDYSILRLQLYFCLFLVSISSVMSMFFSKSFTLFHKVVFSNDYWIFTDEHYLIRILTLDFFMYFFIIGVFSSFLVSLILYFVGRKVND